MFKGHRRKPSINLCDVNSRLGDNHQSSVIDEVNVVKRRTGRDGPGLFHDVQAQAAQSLDGDTVIMPSFCEYQGTQPVLIEQIQHILGLSVDRTYVE